MLKILISHTAFAKLGASVGPSVCLQGTTNAVTRPGDKAGAVSVWPRGPVFCILSLHLTHCSLCLLVVRCLIGAVTMPLLFIYLLHLAFFPLARQRLLERHYTLQRKEGETKAQIQMMVLAQVSLKSKPGNQPHKR